jgi:RNA-binding protein YhbY
MEQLISAVTHFVTEMQKPVNRGAIPEVSFDMATGEHVKVEVRTDHLIDLKEVEDALRKEITFKGMTRGVSCGTYHWHVDIH